MKFNYTPLRDSSSPAGQSRRFIKVPLVEVKLSYGERSADIIGLIDTGATDCLFDRGVADDLGIDLSQTGLEQRTYYGLGGQSVIGHVRRVGFRVKGFNEWIEIDGAFVDAKLPFQLLGQTGFFDNYEVSLRRYRGKFEVKSRSFLHR